MIMPFGKHQGRDLSELPDGYLTWLSEESYIYAKNRRLFAAVKLEMNNRTDTPEIPEAELSANRIAKYTACIVASNEKLVEQLIESWYA